MTTFSIKLMLNNLLYKENVEHSTTQVKKKPDLVLAVIADTHIRDTRFLPQHQ